MFEKTIIQKIFRESPRVQILNWLCAQFPSKMKILHELLTDALEDLELLCDNRLKKIELIRFIIGDLGFIPSKEQQKAITKLFDVVPTRISLYL